MYRVKRVQNQFTANHFMANNGSYRKKTHSQIGMTQTCEKDPYIIPIYSICDCV